jgi:4-alpha-glucanotransferase
MSLHRLFWVPRGREPGDGVYVTYPADELYATLCLESHRNETVVVGEDLGTVPAGVRATLHRHGILGTWVLQGSLRPRAASSLGRVPRRAVASLSTHDMFPFAGFLRGDDIQARVETGQLDDQGALRQSIERRQLVSGLARSLGLEDGAVERLLRKALGYLWGSEAALVLVSADDLTLETRPQNLPGTSSARGNWRRKLAVSVPELGKALARYL